MGLKLSICMAALCKYLLDGTYFVFPATIIGSLSGSCQLVTNFELAELLEFILDIVH